MVDANVFKYVNRMCVIGGRDFDKTLEFPSKAIYVPSEELLVLRDSNSMVYSGPAHTIYTAHVGERAAQVYDKLVEDLGGKAPDKIDVSAAFVAWGKALHSTRNPSKEIADLLNNF